MFTYVGLFRLTPIARERLEKTPEYFDQIHKIVEHEGGSVERFLAVMGPWEYRHLRVSGSRGRVPRSREDRQARGVRDRDLPGRGRQAVLEGARLAKTGLHPRLRRPPPWRPPRIRCQRCSSRVGVRVCTERRSWPAPRLLGGRGRRVGARSIFGDTDESCAKRSYGFPRRPTSAYGCAKGAAGADRRTATDQPRRDRRAMVDCARRERLGDSGGAGGTGGTRAARRHRAAGLGAGRGDRIAETTRTRVAGAQPAASVAEHGEDHQPDAGAPPAVHACIFDLDGVLAMSAEVHAAVWAKTFTWRNRRISTNGRTSRSTHATTTTT